MSSRKDKKPKKKKGKKSRTGALSRDNSTQGGFLVGMICVGFFLNLGRKHFGGPKKKHYGPTNFLSINHPTKHLNNFLSFLIFSAFYFPSSLIHLTKWTLRVNIFNYLMIK